jgi:hypothetical protein
VPNVSQVRQNKINGETITFTEVIPCNAPLAVDITVLGGVAKQHQPFLFLAALIQTLFFGVSGNPVTVYINGVDAVQQVNVTGSPTGGTFTLSGVVPAAWTTAPIAWNATAAQVAAAVQAAIVAVSGGALTTVAGSGGPLPGSPVNLTFGGTLGLMPVTTITANVAGLTGGTPACTPTSVTTGVNPDKTWAFPAGGGFDWSVQDGVFACPIASNVNQISVSNFGSAAAVLSVRVGSN